MGERIGRWEVVPNSNLDAIQTYNKMHAGYLVQMERDRSLKRKWRRLMKIFNSTKPKFSHLFQFVALLVNFLHRSKKNLTYEMVGEHLFDLVDHTWEISNYKSKQALTFSWNSSSKLPIIF